MPKDRASRRNKFNHWDDELEDRRSPGRKERYRPKNLGADLPLMSADQAAWFKPSSGLSSIEVENLSGDGQTAADDSSSSLSLAEINEKLDQIQRLIEKTAQVLQKIRSCGIDFGADMDRQLGLLQTKWLELQSKIQEQAQWIHMESERLQESLGRDSAPILAEMMQFETRKQAAYQGLSRECGKLFAEAQTFDEGVDGLAWNLDQCR